jgi:ribonuclease R
MRKQKDKQKDKHKGKKKQGKKNSGGNGAPHLTFRGRLEVTRSGMGYVVIENEESDVLIRPNDLNNAFNGDTVTVKVIKENPSSGKREGRITEVVQRKQTEFVGRVQLSQHFAFFIPDGERSLPDMYVPLQLLHGAKDGDAVAVKMVQWTKEDKRPVAEVIEVLKEEDVNNRAMKTILAENGFPLTFSDEVLETAARIPDVIDKAEIKKRKDFRKVLTFTIDPVDAKDFDDALSIKLLKKGLYEIGVHIADVSHYVTPGTPLDDEAYLRATSVYLPDRVNPMLPERISNELCSLRPNEDKLTFSAVFQINDQAEVQDYWLGRTVIHSDHRYTYEEVQAVIEGEKDMFDEQVHLLNRLAQTLRSQRFSAGAINFSSQEVRFKLDEKGKPIGIVVKESKEAHQLIEEFMLLANKYVAKHVSEVKVKGQEIPFPYRVHDVPDEVKLQPFIEFARKFGHKFNTSTPQTIAQSFNSMLQEVQGKPEQHVLEQLGIRTMAKATYTTENIGHYGLAFPHYAHFTSPIRRYPDVLVHRVLQTVLDGQPWIDKKMEEKCKHSSERERAAMDSERAGNKYKQVEFMRDYLGEEFEAVISGVSNFGFWAETVEHKCEGMISIASLSDYDEFVPVEGEYMLLGLRTKRTFRMGDKVRIRVVAANLEKRQMDFEWADLAAQPAARPQQRHQKRDKHRNNGKGHESRMKHLKDEPVANWPMAAEDEAPLLDEKAFAERAQPRSGQKPGKAGKAKASGKKPKPEKAVEDETWLNEAEATPLPHTGPAPLVTATPPAEPAPKPAGRRKSTDQAPAPKKKAVAPRETAATPPPADEPKTGARKTKRKS